MDSAHKIVVKKLPIGSSQESIQRLFEASGPVLGVEITDTEGVDATVNYGSYDAASRSVAAFNRNPLLGGGQTQVAFASGQQAEYKIFVGNLPPTTTQEDLTSLFAPYGTVTEAVLLPQKASQSDQRCGFVKYSDFQEATNAIQGVNGVEWGGSKLAVRMADSGPKQPKFNPAQVQAVVQSLYNALPMNAFGMMGAQQAPMGYAQPVANFRTGTGTGTGMEGKLFVGNIPSYWTKDNLAAQFSPYGAMEEVVILARKGINNTQCGFVKFMDPQCAALAVQSLAGTVVDGVEFVVRFADKNRNVGPGVAPGVGPARAPRPVSGAFRPY